MLSPAEFVESYCGIGEKKCASGAGKLLVLSVLAGFFIAMGGAVTNTAAHALENPSVIKIVCGLLFPFGLIMVILTGAELFTGNCLLAIPLLERCVRPGAAVRNLALVYIGNAVGALAAAAGCVWGGQLNLSGGALAVYTIRLAANKCALSFPAALILGILCNVLVCTAVMCALCAKDVAGRAVGAFVPVCFFVLAGFVHWVANLYYVPAGLLALTVPRYAELAAAAGVDCSALSWGSFLVKNLLPVTLGNLLGGLGFGALVWAGHRKLK